MPLPTEPIGSIPRPRALQEGMEAASAGQIPPETLDALFDDAVQDSSISCSTLAAERPH